MLLGIALQSRVDQTAIEELPKANDTTRTYVCLLYDVILIACGGILFILFLFIFVT
jgi:hypothetical protein